MTDIDIRKKYKNVNGIRFENSDHLELNDGRVHWYGFEW